MIPQDTIETIISSSRIEEVVGEFVTLRKRGANFIGLCPFHNEKTPSFTVSATKGIFKCFGCGKAGNVVNFLMEHEHFNYPEALRYLAKKYHIEIEEEEKTAEELQQMGEKEALFMLNDFAQKYFSTVLWQTEEGKKTGLKYLKDRGIRDDIIQKFQLGFSPSKWDAFTEHATGNGFKKDYLLKTGLSLEKEGRFYDRFHERVIFPIHSASGRIIGFGGRILTDDKNRPKYVNSPESDIYNKSKSLYGLFFARTAISQKDTCYLVEGYTDVISLHQAGIANVVASSGTSLTTEQIRMIQRYTSNITILYDGDPAGIKASFRGIDMILEQGMNVRIVLFPEGEDPDSFARTRPAAEVEAFIRESASNFILFKTRLLLEDARKDPIKKAALIREIVESVSLIPDGITRSLYVKECSALLDIQETVLLNEVNRKIREKFTKKGITGEPGREIPDESEGFVFTPHGGGDFVSTEHQEREIIRLMLQYGSETIMMEQIEEDGHKSEVPVRVADFIIHDILSDEIPFENSGYKRIFNEQAEAVENNVFLDKAHFLNHKDPKVATLIIDILINPYELSHNWMNNDILVEPEEDRIKPLVCSTLLSFKARKIEMMIGESQRKMKAARDTAEQQEMLGKLKTLKERSFRINHELGRIVIR